MSARILLIDDDAGIRDSMRMPLEYEGYEYLQAATAEEGITLVQRESPDIVFLDVKMPGMDGMEALSRIKAINESVPVVMISAHGTTSTAFEASKRGAIDFIEKPFGAERLLVTIRNQLDRTRLIDENRSLKRAVEVRHQMVGESPGLRHVWDAIKRAAPTNATVLLLGESGVGKELVARAIHRNSLRCRERFIQVNCAAIPEELIESELFGHEKGSFTGATEKQIGKFEQADRGTIFLDEVGDMSPKTQAKVLRVLQEGEVERLGSARTIKVDVRVIAATNKDLEAGDREGHVPRGPVFPPECHPHPGAAASRSARGHSGAGAALCRPLQPREQSPSAAIHARRRSSSCRRRDGRGTSASCKNTVERLIIMTPGRHRSTSTTCATSSGLRQSAAGDRIMRSIRPARCASSRSRPSGRSWSGSSAKTTGTSRRPRKSSARRGAICTRSSSSTASRRKATAEKFVARRSRPDDRPPSRPSDASAGQAVSPIMRGACSAEAPEGREGGRKVRTPQGSAPGNARSGQLEG